jgi:hypothetical protein
MKLRLKQGVLVAVTALASLLLLIASAASARGQSGPCSNRSIRGEYGFTITGQILGGPAAGPVAGVAMEFFDGQGNLTQLDHVLLNGNPPAVQWRPATGTYSVNADCTGTEEIDFSDGTPSLHLSLVVVLRGREIRVVVNDPGIATTALGIKRDSPL